MSWSGGVYGVESGESCYAKDSGEEEYVIDRVE